MNRKVVCALLSVLSLTILWWVPQASGEASLSYIAFLRDDHLWIMRSDGSEQRPVTPDSVNGYSVSDNGRVVYDRFDPLPSKVAADLSIYYIDDIWQGKPKRITSDNQSVWPVLSPDGRRAVVQKFKWAGKQTYEGEGLGLWLIDLETGDQRPLVELVKIPDEIRKKRDALSLEFGGKRMDERKWIRDEKVMWSPRGDRLLFSRNFVDGGLVTFWLDLAKDPSPKALPGGYVGVKDFSGSHLIVFDNIAFRLFVVDLDTGREKTLAESAFVASAEFAPDGTKIAYYTPSNSAGEEGLWLIPSDGGKRVRLLSGVNISGRLIWSSDGKTLIFEKYDPETDEQEIWSVGLDGSPLIRLAKDASEPQWISKP